MNTINPSEQLTKYFEEVSLDTGRRINVQEKTDLGLSGMNAVFSKHPTDISISFNPTRFTSQKELDKALAHEVTHGLLLYGRKYHSPTPKTKISAIDNQRLGLLMTMIDDIVVNKIIYEKGFDPFSSAYLDMLVKETKAARKGTDIYREFSYDKLLKDNFMVFRYILAWGYFNYFELNAYTKRTIKKFLNTFKKSYPEQFKVASRIKTIINDNNIFTSDGHFIVITKCLSVWGMDDKVTLESVCE